MHTELAPMLRSEHFKLIENTLRCCSLACAPAGPEHEEVEAFALADVQLMNIQLHLKCPRFASKTSPALALSQWPHASIGPCHMEVQAEYAHVVQSLGRTDVLSTTVAMRDRAVA